MPFQWTLVGKGFHVSEPLVLGKTGPCQIIHTNSGLLSLSRLCILLFRVYIATFILVLGVGFYIGQVCTHLSEHRSRYYKSMLYVFQYCSPYLFWNKFLTEMKLIIFDRLLRNYILKVLWPLGNSLFSLQMIACSLALLLFLT